MRIPLEGRAGKPETTSTKANSLNLQLMMMMRAKAQNSLLTARNTVQNEVRAKDSTNPPEGDEVDVEDNQLNLNGSIRRKST